MPKMDYSDLPKVIRLSVPEKNVQYINSFLFSKGERYRLHMHDNSVQVWEGKFVNERLTDFKRAN